MKIKYLAVVAAVGMILCSCGKKVYLITSGSENLTSLTKVTEGENVTDNPGGSVDSDWLFFVQKVGGNAFYYKEANIYKKDIPTAPAQVQITSGGTCVYPTYCVANDRVAFSRLVNGFYDIYMMPATKGNALIPVTETTRDHEYCPSFSPDGSFLAYQRGSLNSAEAEIWLKNLKTGENMLLGKGATPAISPDGKRIAYAKIENNKTRNIWVMDIDGSNARQLTASKEEFAGYPKWSPNGTKIVFQANKKKGNFDIFVMNIDGSGLMQLTTNESDDLTPFWSGDGYIYFASDRGDNPGKYNIWRFLYRD